MKLYGDSPLQQATQTLIHETNRHLSNMRMFLDREIEDELVRKTALMRLKVIEMELDKYYSALKEIPEQR